jgi:hypothetical protein
MLRPLLFASSVMLGVVTSPLFAQLPAARLTNVFPPGGQAGTTVEVTVAGSDLDEPERLHFPLSGITGKPKNDGAQFLVTIAPNVPPGVYEARFVGRFGISNPRPFVVGAVSEFTMPATNTTMTGATPIVPDTTINSRAAPNAVAWFKFIAKKSQRLFIECAAETIDSRMRATLVLTDAAGRELEHNRQGGLIDFTAPAEAAFFLKVSDVLYRGGDEYFYRLTVATGPRIDFVLPPAGLPGTKTNFTLYGRHLPNGKAVKDVTIDGKPLEQLTVAIETPINERTRQRLSTGFPVRPPGAVMDGFEYRLSTPKGFSNPVLLGFATAPVVLEQEPNSKPAQAQALTLPCEVAGQFFPTGDQDWFRFEAKKGDVFWIEVFSQRLGLPTSPFVLIQRAKKNDKGEEEFSDMQEIYEGETNIGDREFNTATRDPVSRLEAKEDGGYRILVRDLFQRTERSPRFVYRLSLRRESPDFRLVAQSLSPRFKADAKDIPIGVPFLRRGETIPLRVMVFRRDGFNGEIELALENPPPGLLFDGDRIPAGKNSTFVLFTAADNAPAFAGPVKLIGKAKVGDKELVREARGGTMIFPVHNTDNERPESRMSRELTLSISDKETAPISIAVAEQRVFEASANSKVEIPLRVIRRGDFTGNLKLKPLGPGATEGLKEFDLESKATNATLKLDLAALKLAPGTHIFAVQGQTGGKYRNNPEAADLAEAAAKEADKLAGELATLVTQRSEDFDKAGKALTEVEAVAKAAQEKLTAAKAAAGNAPAEEGLKSDLDAAQKTAAEADLKLKAATESRATAEKAKTAAETKAKEAQLKKEETAKRAKELSEKAKPRDVNYQVTSAPIPLKVVPAQVAAAKEEKAAKDH